MNVQNSNSSRKGWPHLIAAGLCLVLFGLVAYGQFESDVERTTDQNELARIAIEAHGDNVRRAAVEKLTNQAVLAKIAVEDKSWDVHNAAVRKLTDQTALAKIAIEDKDSTFRYVAVKKLTNQAVLTRIAVKDEDSTIRRTAVAKLTNQTVLAEMAMWIKPELTRQVTDQALLAKIAVEARDSDIRCAAVERLTDESLLAKIVVEDKDGAVRRAALTAQPGLLETFSDQTLLARIATDMDMRDNDRRAAVEKLTDQTMLAKIATDSHIGDNVRCAAVEKLTNQGLLAKVVASEKLLVIRLAAIGRITDQSPLRQWAEKEPQAAIRQAAVARITNDAFLVQRLLVEPSAAVRAAIVGALRGKDSLRGVALSAYHETDREQALQRLKKDFQDAASEAAKARETLTRRVEALAKETDNGKLLALAADGECEFDVLRAAAARCLNDPSVLEQAATRASDREVLKILLAKLEDKAALNRIAAGANDRAVRLAAARKAGAKSWTDIFAAATAGGSPAQMLGDALAAVSLFPEVQPDARDGVQQACLNLIRRGNESRIPEMVDLLEGYGDTTLAEDFLNCGQPDLDAAGRSWASRHGYFISTGAGSHRATWGSGR